VKVSGTSILTRKALVTREFGAEAWRVFFRDMALVHPFFRRPITGSTQVPAPEFLAFHDELDEPDAPPLAIDPAVPPEALMPAAPPAAPPSLVPTAGSLVFGIGSMGRLDPCS
jgi:hypothetical protein